MSGTVKLGGQKPLQLRPRKIRGRVGDLSTIKNKNWVFLAKMIRVQHIVVASKNEKMQYSLRIVHFWGSRPKSKYSRLVHSVQMPFSTPI